MRTMCLVAGLLPALLAANALGEKGLYTVVDLGTLPGGVTSHAKAINSRGQVAGWSHEGNVRRPVLWDTDGSCVDIGNLGVDAPLAQAQGINSAGQVVGISRALTGWRAFLWDADNGIQNLGDLPGGSDYSEACGINSAGQVVGISGAATGYRGFLWDAKTGMQDLGDLPGGEDISYARAINNHGQVAGQSKTTTSWRAFLWDDVTGMRNLGDLPGGDNMSSAFAVNDGGQVVGFSDAATGWRAFLWDTNTGMQDLGDLPGGRNVSIARAINNSGQVVGGSHAAPGTRAFLWDADNGMRNIEDLVDDSGANWELRDAYGINDLGHIVGHGASPEGPWHAFLLIPGPAAFEVAVDIRPRSDPNRINLLGNGALPVAIMGSEEFDVHDVDQASLELQGAAAEEKGKSGIIGAFKDIDRDGFLDLVIHFCMSEMELDPDATEAELTGLLLDGTGIFGTDAVRLVGGKGIDSATLQHIPEPASAAILLVGLAAVMQRRRRK